MITTFEDLPATDIKFYTLLGTKPAGDIVALHLTPDLYSTESFKVHSANGMPLCYVETLVSDLWTKALPRPLLECDTAITWYECGQQQYLDRVLAYYVIDDRREVYAFLEDAQPLVEILEEAPLKIEQIFGDAISISLDLLEDQEEEVRRLYLKILTEEDPDSAIDLLDRLDSDWWLRLSPEIRKQILVDVRSTF